MNCAVQPTSKRNSERGVSFESSSTTFASTRRLHGLDEVNVANTARQRQFREEELAWMSVNGYAKRGDNAFV